MNESNHSREIRVAHIERWHAFVDTATSDHGTNLVALQVFGDKQGSREIWTSVVGDPTIGEYVASAPVAWNGLVIVGDLRDIAAFVVAWPK